MPLSEYEQRVLEQMERQLTSDDPKLATTLRSNRRRSGARLIIAGVGLVVGLVLLVVGVANSQSLLGVLGFAAMFAAVTYAFSGPHHSGPVGIVAADGKVTMPPGRSTKRNRASFMSRLEQRWDRRREDRGR